MMGAVDFLKACSQGSLTAAEYAENCLAEIDRTDSRILAWQHLDREQIAKDAEQADTASAVLALRGVPVGIKDIIDTADAPCEYGSAVYTGHRPAADAGLITTLRQAGAVIMGKTVTTEFAYLEKAGPVTRTSWLFLQVALPAVQPRRWRPGIFRWRWAHKPAGQ